MCKLIEMKIPRELTKVIDSYVTHRLSELSFGVETDVSRSPSGLNSISNVI